MNPKEPRREMLPSRLSDVAPPSAIFARSDRFEEPGRFDSTTSGHKGSSTEWIGRAFRRHWWRILPLWLAGSAAIWSFLPRWFPNSYEATSVVQVDSGDGGSGPEKGAEAAFSTFKETQARRIVTPNMIASALANHPELAKRLATDQTTDPELAIIRGISAVLLPNTNLIQVTMIAAKDDALAEIVDAVIEAYLRVATVFNEQGALERSARLKNLVRAKEAQVKQKQNQVSAMVAETGTLDANEGRARHVAAIEQHAALSDQLLKTDLEVVDDQAKLDRVRLEETAMAAASSARPKARAESEAVAAFYNLPEVVAIKDQLDQVKRDLVLADREPAKDNESARKGLRRRNDELQRQVDNAWAKLGPGLMIATSTEPRDKPLTESSKQEAKLDGLKARQAMLNDRLDKMNRENLKGGSKVLALEFARQDLTRTETVLETMTQTLSQAEVASNQPVARFHQEYRAKTLEKSASLPRWLVGSLGPLLVMLGLLGFFGLIEKRAGRILDPSDLPSKARLNVIGLVPPLPKNRGRTGLTSAARQRSQMDVERFIQSLDQLRVIVCGRGDGNGRPRRSLLITSAGENEGKSTLAAQLAERSVNAGLLTLLIDADLRNPTLSRMFDRPDSVGLANVLRGELLAEEAIGVVAEAGGFHFLPAGLVRDDLSRLLQSDRLGRLLESARESFDLVLVDSPPVLPVADALTIGQWVDGAIITVRHKISRLPLVERATRQLSSVGISIVGAVVSGVKDRHAPYYGSKPTSDPERRFD